MINILYKKIVSNQEVRKSLIALRKELKEAGQKQHFFKLLANDYSTLYKLLEAEDAKVRKNAALILGELQAPGGLEKLYNAYEKEEKLFIKSDYLVAISNYSYEQLLEPLKKRLDFLTNHTFEQTSQKHIQEEIRILTKMCLDIDHPKEHVFTGYEELSDLILLTNREYKEVTLNQIKKGKAKEFNAGVIVRTDDLNEIMGIRTYTELLFCLKEVTRIPQDLVRAAKALYKGDLLGFLNQRHEGDAPYYFRIEVKGKMPLDKKSSFTKKMAAALESVSNRQLINSTSHYEFEIRLIQNKEGTFNVLIKLYTLKDKRFSYRKNTIAASIAPHRAGLVMELAKDYLRENAAVLDPFCGVGTMLIERNKCKKSKIMYGVDIFGKAIDGAIENANLDDTDIYFINRDFFDFEHKYLFDEILTNMPTQTTRKSALDIATLYEKFFRKVPDMVKDGAILVLYTRDKHLVEKQLTTGTTYTLLKQWEIYKKVGAYLYVLQVSK